MDKLQEFKTHYAEAIKAFNEKMSYEELKSHLMTLIKFVEQFKKQINLEMGHLDSKYTAVVNQIETDCHGDMEKVKKMMLDFCQKEMRTLMETHRTKITELDNKMARIDAIQPPDEAILAKTASDLAITAIKPLIPEPYDLASELPKKGDLIATALELLPDGEKLKIDAIQNLQEELDKLKKLIRKSGTVYVGGGSSGGGRIVKSYDISSQLNGVLKTFSLPAFYRVISVHSSSFPNAFRETVDYTTDASAMTITFTSEITADTTLATGQTITIVYSE